jgi:hypothetical protein
MTALTQYQRIEAAALWREHGAEQRRDVIVSLGDSTLIISDLHERPLTHWSLSAIKRDNPGKTRAIYRPDNDSHETLELAANEDTMVEAIETLCRVIDRRRPKRGRMRMASLIGISFAVMLLILIWVPVAIRDYAVRVVPMVSQIELGERLSLYLRPYTGQPCSAPIANLAVKKLRDRILGPDAQLEILRQGLRDVLVLPGNIYLASSHLVEDYEDPDVLAGYLLVAKTAHPPELTLRDTLRETGTLATFGMLTTGHMSDGAIQNYADTLIKSAPVPVDTDRLVAAFSAANLRLAPYAYARDITGEQTLPLLEAEAIRTDTPRAALSDRDWVSLQGICGG